MEPQEPIWVTTGAQQDSPTCFRVFELTRNCNELVHFLHFVQKNKSPGWQHSGPYLVLLQVFCSVNERIPRPCATTHFSFVWKHFLCHLNGRETISGRWPRQLHFIQGPRKRKCKGWCKWCRTNVTDQTSLLFGWYYHCVFLYSAMLCLLIKCPQTLDH